MLLTIVTLIFIEKNYLSDMSGRENTDSCNFFKLISFSLESLKLNKLILIEKQNGSKR